jgi:peptidyl-prolyl cis-trans isomerase B (cyclophilin B)
LLKRDELYSNVAVNESSVNEISYNSHFSIKRQKNMIILETNMGEIHITVDKEKAPITAKNFTDYVEDGFFDGTIFHRVIPNFMIQGGGMTEDMQQKTTKANIENEAKNGLKNVKYSVAMARTTAPHSASSQFFINVADNQFLDFPGQDGWGYCVFGEVVAGQDIVDKIEKVETLNLGGHADVPGEVVIITKASIKE